MVEVSGRRRSIADLLSIMTALRTPETGCPWDLEQSFASIAPYTVEEAYEVADAIAREDFDDLRDELGDLLLQVVFHARMAEEAALFDFADVVEAICDKLIRRHPHVFGEKRGQYDAAAVSALWQEIKKRERAAKRPSGRPGALDGVPPTFPALARADKLTRKAAVVGFDWSDAGQVRAKVLEELEEVREAAASGDPGEIKDEVGDLLFAIANLARHHEVDPETALQAANRKFERRFRAVEEKLALDGSSPQNAGLARMEALWSEVKAEEAKASSRPRESDA